MKAQLEDVVDAPSGFLLKVQEGVGVPGIEDEGLFADGVGRDAQGEADMGVVEVVGRGDRNVMDPLGLVLAPQLLGVPVSGKNRSRIPTESDRSRAATRLFPVSTTAWRWRGATYPAAPIRAKFFISPNPRPLRINDVLKAGYRRWAY